MDAVILFAVVGFVAQLVDGALGMAYGVTVMAVLLSLGVAPVAASAGVHTAEVATTGISSFAHWQFGNVDGGLFKRLVVPGMLGGAAGACLLAAIPEEVVRPFVSAYLLVTGVIILWSAWRGGPFAGDGPRRLVPLGLFGGFFDAAGGGGWGAIVTATLLSKGATPRYAIGSVNAAEFFVAATVTATFVATVGLVTHWEVVTGLVLGGAAAAPIAAHVVRWLPERPLMVLVGAVIMLLSIGGLLEAVG